MKRTLFGLCCVLLFGLFAFTLPVRAVEPVVTSSVPEAAALVFSEVYPNGQNINPNNQSDESNSEFVEIYNRGSSAVQLSDYVLSRPDNGAVYPLSGQLQPDSYVAIYPSFSIVNSGGTIALTNNQTSISVSMTYTAEAGASEDFSFHLTDSVADTWLGLTPTPGLTPPASEPIDPPEEPPVEEPPIEEEPPLPQPCAITDVHLSEMVANPSGSDALGGEFIELYNNGETAVSLEGCALSTDKMSAFNFTAEHTIPPKTYYVINLADKLLNGGGTVTFQTATYEEVVQYTALGDDEAWAFVTGNWQLTTLATPNAPNLPSPLPGKGSGDEEIKEVAEPCPAGKYRNPATGRCKNFEATVATLTPCGPGKVRNPATNRCRNVTSTASSSLTPCEPGQERNPATNRCRKIAAATNELTPCKEGYERNKETNRCRKVESPAANTAHIEETGKQNPTYDLLVLGIAGAAITAFLIFEYRHTLWAQIKKLRLGKKA